MSGWLSERPAAMSTLCLPNSFSRDCCLQQNTRHQKRIEEICRTWSPNPLKRAAPQFPRHFNLLAWAPRAHARNSSTRFLARNATCTPAFKNVEEPTAFHVFQLSEIKSELIRVAPVVNDGLFKTDLLKLCISGL